MRRVSVHMHLRQSAGFTLVEVLVAVALFMVVMTVATGALLSIIHANKKAQAIQTAVTNVHMAIDSLVRSVRMGTTYHCSTAGLLNQPRDCLGGADAIAFLPHGKPRGAYRLYYYKKDANGAGGIYRKDVNEFGTTVSDIQITAPEVDITDFRVYVRGSAITDQTQPVAIFLIKGVVGSGADGRISIFGSKEKLQTEFIIQSAATQRLIDL